MKEIDRHPGVLMLSYASISVQYQRKPNSTMERIRKLFCRKGHTEAKKNHLKFNLLDSHITTHSVLI